MIEQGLNAGPTFDFTYDFAKHGGAVGSITVGPKLIPPQTIIIQCSIRVVTAVTSAGAATVAMHLLSSEDVLTATAGAKANLTLDALVVGVPVAQTAATWILTTAATQLTVVVGTAALTAGKLNVNFIGHRSITA